MTRPVRHHAYVERPFDAVCEELEQRGHELIPAATLAASGFAADLAGYLEQRLGFFDRDERVNVVIGDLERSPAHCVVPIEWAADETRRLLPNVTASIHITPIISSGPGATCELLLEGTFTPPRPRHRGLVEHALSRRVIDATLHVFVRHLVDQMSGHARAA